MTHTAKSNTANTVALLLAAGLSTRMGRLKALLDWHDEPLVAYQVRQLRQAGVDAVLVVTGHEADAVERALAGTSAVAVRNAEYRAGRATSIRAGANAVEGRPELLVLLNVDQPRDAETIRRLIEAHRTLGGLITVPSHRGERGHPAVISGALLNELRSVSEESEGLKAVMRRHTAERREVEFEDGVVLLDLNTPDAYERARS